MPLTREEAISEVKRTLNRGHPWVEVKGKLYTKYILHIPRGTYTARYYLHPDAVDAVLAMGVPIHASVAQVGQQEEVL